MSKNYVETTFEKVKEAANFYQSTCGKRLIRLKNNKFEGLVGLKSEAAKMFLRKTYSEAAGKLPNTNTLKELEELLNFEAYNNSKELKPKNRIAHRNKKKKVYLDIGDGECAIVSAQGIKLERRNDTPFIRGHSFVRLPKPDFSEPKAALKLYSLINVSNDDFPLCIAWLMAFFMRKGTFPILNLHGEFGSAKTTTLSILKSVIDPTEPLKHPMPVNEKDLVVATSPYFSVAFDNVSAIPKKTSDALCKLVDGSSFVTRKLYTDSDVATISSKSIIGINGIGNSVIRGDLLSRTLDIEPPYLDTKVSSEAIWDEFKRLHPKILGSLLLAVKHGLKNLYKKQSAPEGLDRLADFCVWTQAWETFFFKEGEVLNRLGENREYAQRAPLEAEVIGKYLLEFSKDVERWEGTPTKLLKEMNSLASPEERLSKSWPKNASYMGRIVENLKPALRAEGVHIHRNGKQKNRNISIYYEEDDE